MFVFLAAIYDAICYYKAASIIGREKERRITCLTGYYIVDLRT